MSNDITDKYFTQIDFSKKEKKVLDEVLRLTGFEIDKKIFRGVIYDKDKVGSLIYSGKYQDKPAVLKLQGLRPEITEEQIIQSFNDQNQSKRIRLPELYFAQKWTEKKGYGFLITELIEAPHIFNMPFASAEQMKEYAQFYQEYRTKAITRPWFKKPRADTKQFTLLRVNKWKQICLAKKRIPESMVNDLFKRFADIAEQKSSELQLVFCHAHLTADDIFRESVNQYVLLSNLFWGYRLQWYELVFNIWACLLAIRDENYKFEQMLEYINSWINTYKTIPVVQADPDFESKMNYLLLERTIGAILADLGANDNFADKKIQPVVKNLLDLHFRLFDHLYDLVKK